LGGRLVYELKVLMGYQKILDPKDIQTFYGKKNFKNLRDFVKVED
jgi:hypothetical protein